MANLPSHPRVKFLSLNGSVPVAQTRWSEPITLRTGTAAGVLVLPLAPIPQLQSVGGTWGGPGGLHTEHQWRGVRCCCEKLGKQRQGAALGPAGIRWHRVIVHGVCTVQLYIVFQCCIFTLPLHIAFAHCNCTLHLHTGIAQCVCMLHFHSAVAHCDCPCTHGALDGTPHCPGVLVPLPPLLLSPQLSHSVTPLQRAAGTAPA